MEQNIFDNDEFFNGYKQLRESDENLNILLEQPAMASLLPDIAGKSVLDLGCGYGHNCLDFVTNKGAKRAVGIDISEKMLNIAKRESSSKKIEYRCMSMTDICSLGESFDLIYSSLAFHYIEDFDKLATDMFSMLNSGGYILFSQEHPMVTATLDGKGHYNLDENGKRVSYTLSNYNEPGERKIHWYIDGVIKHHRPMGVLITSLARAGFIIDTVCEPTPEPWAIERLPKLYKEFIRPNFIIIKAHKA